jgi:hypothetical protein
MGRTPKPRTATIHSSAALSTPRRGWRIAALEVNKRLLTNGLKVRILFGDLIVPLRKSPPQELSDAEVPTSRLCRVFCCLLASSRESSQMRGGIFRGHFVPHLDEALCFVERAPPRKLTADPGTRKPRGYDPIGPKRHLSRRHRRSPFFWGWVQGFR